MSKIFTKDYLLFLLLSSSSILFSAFIFRTIYPIHFNKFPLFFSDLLGYPISLPVWLIYLLGFSNLLLIWLIGKIVFQSRWVCLPPLILGFSPWFAYSVVSGSFFIYLLCLILINCLALFLIKFGRESLGGILFFISSVLMLYSSLLTFFVYPFLLSGVILTKFIPFNKITSNLFLIIIICLPLLLLVIKNPAGLGNIYKTQVNLLSDPGIINTVNTLQGESKKSGFSYFSKVSENKYIYISKYIILKKIKNIMPQTFFTPEERLLGFSFEPPIYVGFLLPFLYGIYLIVGSKTLRKYLIFSLALIIPSFLSQKIVDLNRLILFEPVVIFIIIYGLMKLNDKKNTIGRLTLLFCFALVLIQFSVIFLDINFREYPRFERFNGILHWQIDQQ